MKDDEFQAAIGVFFESCIALQRNKRSDYTGGGDPLANYAQAADIMGVKVEIAMLGRLQEKVKRLSVLYRSGDRPLTEPILDSLRDIAILAALLSTKGAP